MKSSFKLVLLLVASMTVPLHGEEAGNPPAPKAADAKANENKSKGGAQGRTKARAKSKEKTKEEAKPEPATNEAPEEAGAVSPTKGGTPDPKAWIERLFKEKGLQKGGSFPNQILIVKKISNVDQPEIAEVDQNLFDEAGYLKIIPRDNIDLFFRLNKKPDNIPSKRKKKKKPEEWLKLLFVVSEADTILSVEDQKEWKIYRLENNRPVAVLSKPAPAGREAKDIHSWFLNSLGYEGVVIDQDGEYLLVGTLESLKKEDAQALVLGNSADKFFLSKQEKKGTGLVQLQAKYRGYGVFQKLLGDSDSDSAPIGTKITIERGVEKKQGKKGE